MKVELDDTRQKVKELLTIKSHLEAEVKVSQRRRRELETELDGGLLDDVDGKASPNKVCVCVCVIEISYGSGHRSCLTFLVACL